MKTKLRMVSVLLIGILFATACGSQPTTVPDVVETVVELDPTQMPAGSVEDLSALSQALQAAGITVEVGDEVEQPFFTVTGQILKVNGADLQVFVYDTAEVMEADAAQVAEDGGSVGTNMVSWMGPPHFYKTGRILVLYVGDDQKLLDVLTGVLGPQFAGR